MKKKVSLYPRVPHWQIGRRHMMQVVKRFKGLGLMSWGVPTRLSSAYAVTESTFRGPCLNPWNLGHTPGGSSGGSAAAVAARMVPITCG